MRAQNRIAANRPFREGMERVLRLTAAADPQAAAKLLGTPERPVASASWPSSGTGAWPAPTTRACCEPPSAASPSYGRAGRRSPSGRWARRRPSYFRYRGIETAQSFVGVADRPEFADARHIAAVVAAPFVSGDIDLVEMISTRFISAGTQRVERRQMLPLPLPESDEEAAEPEEHPLEGYTEFEPEPAKLLVELAPRALEAEIFAALLEGTASFFTAQQRAMAAATENADELVRTLTRVMNRARQDAITTEIMEIVGGAEALRQAKGA